MDYKSDSKLLITNPTPQEIFHGNLLIADYMGWEIKKYKTSFADYNLIEWVDNDFGLEQVIYAGTDSSSLTDEEGADYSIPFYYSFDWLMQVVEKLERYRFEHGDDGTNEIYNFAYLRTFHGNKVRINRYPLFEGSNKLDALWKAIIYFIESLKQNEK